MTIEGYEFLSELGGGGYSDIYRVRSVKYDRLFVAKVARVCETLEVEHAWGAFDREVKALMKLSHPNIVKMYDALRLDSNFIIILEDCPNGSLGDYIEKNGRVHGPLLVRITRDLCSALRYAWEQGVQHRDVKPENIMFDEGGKAKLVDFGISNVTNGVKVSDFRCTTRCASPEIVKRQPHDPVKTDIWAFGVTILWIAGGVDPWHAKTKDELYNKIMAGRYTVPGCLPPMIESMVEHMLRLDPSERIMPKLEQFDEFNLGEAVYRPASRAGSFHTVCKSFMRPGLLVPTMSPHIGRSPMRKSFDGTPVSAKAVIREVGRFSKIRRVHADAACHSCAPSISTVDNVISESKGETGLVCEEDELQSQDNQQEVGEDVNEITPRLRSNVKSMSGVDLRCSTPKGYMSRQCTIPIVRSNFHKRIPVSGNRRVSVTGVNQGSFGGSALLAKCGD